MKVVLLLALLTAAASESADAAAVCTTCVTSSRSLLTSSGLQAEIRVRLQFKASECDSTKVKGQTGQNVTLPCKYDRKYYRALDVCWGRGELPNSGCSNQLISSDGYRVKTRASSRYELLGRLEDGDVSLTILNLTEGDAGRYGCRVAIPGLFNDEKHHFDLTVVPAPQIHTSAASHTETPSEPTAAAQTGGTRVTAAGHMTSRVSCSSSSMMSSSENQAPAALMTPLICILLGLVFMLTLSGLFIASRRLKQPNKIPQQQQMDGSSAQQVQVSSTVDNVYQIDGDGDGGGDGGSDEGKDGGVYEYCP